MNVMTEKKNLKTLRKELDPPVTQEDLARTAGLTLNTYRKAERGGPISYTTAQNSLTALNLFRGARGLPPIESVEDLDWKIV